MIAGTLLRGPSSVAQLVPPELAAQLDTLDVLSRKILTGKLQGERRSKRRGRSVEFDDYREYVPGDDLRHIDWNVLARLDRFFIKVFQEEQDLALHIVLDASASMNAGGAEGKADDASPDSKPSSATAPVKAVGTNKLLFASRLAAALGYVGLVNNNRVIVSIITGSGIRQLEPLRGRQNTQRLTKFILDEAFNELAGAQVVGGARDVNAASADPGAVFTQSMRRLAMGQSGRGVFVVVSDFLIPPPETYEPGLRLLAAASQGAAAGGAAGRSTSGGMDVYLLQTLAPTEIDPLGSSTSGDERVLGDLRMLDVETNKPAEVTVTPELVAVYRASVQKYIKTLHDFATARGLTHAMVTTDTPISALVVDTLRRRGLLK